MVDTVELNRERERLLCPFKNQFSYLLNNLSTTHIMINIKHIPANTHSMAGSVYGSELELFFANDKKKKVIIKTC